MAQNPHSTPNLIDGLTQDSRKVLFTCLKRNEKRAVPVPKLAGAMMAQAAHEGSERSRARTIITLAQDYCGSNNISLLRPAGGLFGTRLHGGHDAGHPRSLCVRLSPLTRLIFHPHDDALLTYVHVDGQSVEPEYYVPIIPMLLVNGADDVPKYNPRELVKNLRRMIAREAPIPMKPWYKGFRGEITEVADQLFVARGEISVLHQDACQLLITELPIGCWTNSYKEKVLDKMLCDKKPSILDYKEYNTDTTVRFVISLEADKFSSALNEGLHNFFKLESPISIVRVKVLDTENRLWQTNSVISILEKFFSVRMAFYEKRKQYREGILKAEACKLSNQARFILEMCIDYGEKLSVHMKPKDEIICELASKKFDSDPVKRWKAEYKSEAQGVSSTQLEFEEETLPTATSRADQDYDYLLELPLWSLTHDAKYNLIKESETKQSQLRLLEAKTPSDLWIDDLTALITALEKEGEEQPES